MGESRFEILVIGNSPLALLLSGLLAERHSRRVCLLAEPLASTALPRAVDLSVAPATRPSSWALAKRLVDETRELLTKMGAAEALISCDPMIVGSGSATLEALQHMRHVAIGHGHVVDRVADTDIGPGSVGYRFAGAVRIDRTRLYPRLTEWIGRLGVRRIPALPGMTVLRNDGSSRLAMAEGAIVADRTIFADEQAIAGQLASDRRDGLLRIDTGRAVLTEPARMLPAPVMLHVDRGATLVQGEDGAIVGLMRGAADTALERLGACLVPQGPLRRAGEAGFLVSSSADGAPIVGPVRGSRALMVAGLGPWATFFAPGLARWIETSSEGAEAEWFAAHAPQRGAVRPAVADFILPGTVGVAA